MNDIKDRIKLLKELNKALNAIENQELKDELVRLILTENLDINLNPQSNDYNVEEFLKESCETIPGKYLFIADIYNYYLEFCNEHNYDACTKHMLGRILSIKGIARRLYNGYTTYNISFK